MALKSLAVAVPNAATTLYTCPATMEASAHGLVFCNTTGTALTFSLAFYRQALGTTVTVISAQSVAANSTFAWPKPVNLQAGDYIVVTSSVASGLVVLCSVYEGSATPVAAGFNPRGTWSSGSTYSTNDLVTLNGSSYYALQTSTNQNPATATAYWMVAASIGTPGQFSNAQVINAQIGTSYTLAATDAGYLVTMNNAAAMTLNIPTDAAVTIAVGVHIDLMRLGAGTLTVSPNNGVTLRATPGAKLRAQYSGATLVKIDANTWGLFGDLSA